MATNVVILVNCIVLAVGNSAAPLLSRLYFTRGGSWIWFSSTLLTAGWPIMFIPLTISYFRRRSFTNNPKFFLITTPLSMAAALLGILLGLINFLYAYGVSILPVSTISLVMSSQLMFNALFSFLVVKQRFTPFSINSVFLLTLGAVLLGLHTTSQAPATQSRAKYILGFFMTLGAASLYGLVLPLLQLAYKISENENTYTHIIEVQTVMSISATIFSAIGMAASNDYQAISREITVFGMGEMKYVILVVSIAAMWQLFYLGLTGIISCSSSLLAGVIETSLLPFTQIWAIIFLHEKFNVEKGISLALSIWALGSFLYGEKLKTRRQRQNSGPPLDAHRPSTPPSSPPQDEVI